MGVGEGGDYSGRGIDANAIRDSQDAFASLLSKYGASDPSAVPYIENERANGISANGALERATAELGTFRPGGWGRNEERGHLAD